LCENVQSSEDENRRALDEQDKENTSLRKEVSLSEGMAQLQEIAAVESRKKDLEGEVVQLLKERQRLEQEVNARQEQIAASTVDPQSLHAEVERLQKELAVKAAIVSTNETLQIEMAKLREEMQCFKEEVNAKEQLIKDG
jgi:hypothetical protein